MVCVKDNKVLKGSVCKCQARLDGLCNPNGLYVVKRASTCILFKDEKKAIKYNKGDMSEETNSDENI
jgi:hypothetical protein